MNGYYRIKRKIKSCLDWVSLTHFCYTGEREGHELSFFVLNLTEKTNNIKRRGIFLHISLELRGCKCQFLNRLLSKVSAISPIFLDYLTYM